MQDLKGKWVLITGAARGLGRLAAKTMAGQGCNLILHSRDTEHTKALEEEFKAMGLECHSVAADLNDIPSVQKMLEEIDALGVQVGPGFFNSLHNSGLSLNLLALCVVLLSLVLPVLMPWTCGINLADAVGIMCGATTNTPALAAAQQTLSSLNVSASGAALGCAVTYPMGVVGVILALLFMRKLMAKTHHLIIKPDNEDADTTFIAAYQVHNPGIFGKAVKEALKLND